MTNRQFSSDSIFVFFCQAAGVQPTKRQASKFRAHKGSAWEKLREKAYSKSSAPNHYYQSLREGSATLS